MKRSALFIILLLLSLLPLPVFAVETAKTTKNSTAVTTKSTKSPRTVRTKTTRKSTRRRSAGTAQKATTPTTEKAAAEKPAAEKAAEGKASAEDKAAVETAGKAETAEEKAASEGIAKNTIIKVVKAALRSKPVQGSKSIRLLSQFTPVEVLSTEGSYAKVATGDGATGYVATSYLGSNSYVSTAGSSVKVRSGPGDSDTALFALKEHYPLQVLEKSGDRVKVKDFEGDGGWVHENMLSAKNYVIAKEKTINLREGPGVQHPKRFIADRGALFEVMEEKEGWLRLKYSDGDEGWCSAKIVWGWLSE